MRGVLNSPEDMRQFLLQPENQFTSNLDIVRWNKNLPALAHSRIDYLMSDPGLAEIIYVEYLQRNPKRRSEREESDG